MSNDTQVDDMVFGAGGKVYAAYLMENLSDPFKSKPLCAALLRPEKGGMPYSKLKYAIESNGHALLSIILLESDVDLPMSALDEQFRWWTKEKLQTTKNCGTN